MCGNETFKAFFTLPFEDVSAVTKLFFFSEKNLKFKIIKCSPPAFTCIFYLNDINIFPMYIYKQKRLVSLKDLVCFNNAEHTKEKLLVFAPCFFFLQCCTIQGFAWGFNNLDRTRQTQATNVASWWLHLNHVCEWNINPAVLLLGKLG